VRLPEQLTTYAGEALRSAAPIRRRATGLGAPGVGEGTSKGAKRPRSEAKPSVGGPPQSKGAKRPRSEAKPSEGGPPQEWSRA
jgi:hypothetical protein